MTHLEEVAPERFDASDRAGIQRHLEAHGYACVKSALTPHELSHAHDLLWGHLEGTEEVSSHM